MRRWEVGSTPIAACASSTSHPDPPRANPHESLIALPPESTLEALCNQAPSHGADLKVPRRTRQSPGGSTVLADAVRQGLIVANPAAGADLPPPQDFAGQEIPPAHTDAIRAALLELAPSDPLRNEPDSFYVHLFDVALGTGLRLGELRALRALRFADVDRDRRLVRVERAYSIRELRRPKTEAGVRSVPLFASVDSALRALAARAVERGRYAPDELVFATARGTPLHPSNFNRRTWQPALRHAGLAAEGYRFHDLRHTCVSRLVAAGADVKLVQAVAGHANPLITLKRYSHLLDERITEAAARFDPARIQ